VKLIGAAGLESLDDLGPRSLNRRVQGTKALNYAELYPDITDRCLLSEADVPDNWRGDWHRARPDRW
jgi:hypothetical protein